MAMLMDPWPSQRGGVSDRHTALARMRQRPERVSLDEDEAPRSLLPRARGASLGVKPDMGPPLPRPCSRGSGVSPAGRPTSASRTSTPRRWDPTRFSDEERRRPFPRASERYKEDCDEVPSRKDRSRRDRDARDDSRRDRLPIPDKEFSSRMRGPSARGLKGCEDEGVPREAQNADFSMLQEMISQGIQDSERGASQLEVVIRDDEQALRKHREDVRRRRQEDADAREQARMKAKAERKRAEEERERRKEAEMKRFEQQEAWEREEKKRVEDRCHREFRAVVRIQASFRGWRSRAGRHVESPLVQAKQHTKPLKAFLAGMPEPELLF